MNATIKAIVTTVATSFTLAAAWWAWSLTADPLVRKSVVSVYQLKAEAEQRFELLAAEQEADRLRTSLELLKIRLEKYRDLASVRPLSEAEQIELRSVEREIEVILDRLATKG